MPLTYPERADPPGAKVPPAFDATGDARAFATAIRETEPRRASLGGGVTWAIFVSSMAEVA
jgi:hypothetical protein